MHHIQSKGTQINGDKLVENGVYDYLNGGIAPSGKWNELNTPGGTVTISEGGNSCGFVQEMIYVAKVAILMPYPALQEVAETIIDQYPRLKAITIEYVHTSGIAARSKMLEEKGCELIIARGLQARMVRAAVLIPVIEMRASTQEVAGQVLELKKKMNLPAGQRAKIGIVGFFNMFRSLDRLGEMMDADVRVYAATSIDQYIELVDRAYEDGCQGVIGGEVVGRRAETLGMSYCFLAMGEESVREALEMASLVGYSIDLLKRSNAEMSAMLDNTSFAILQVNEKGYVHRANRAFYQLLGDEANNVIGQQADAVIGDLPQEALESALSDGVECDAALVTLAHRHALLSITPVCVEDRIEGAILTFQEGKRVAEMDSRLRQEAVWRGTGAQYFFEQLHVKSLEMQQAIAQLKRLSRYTAAVLLVGEPGTGKGMLAQCMHNESLQRSGPFVTADCSIWHPEDMDEKLFGRFGKRKDPESTMVQMARGGTLYLRQVHLLSLETQYKLLQLCQGRYLSNETGKDMSIDVRIIVSNEINLYELMLSGQFRKDLYYALSACKIEIPPLRSCKADIAGWFESYLANWCAQFARQVRLTDDAWHYLVQYDWPGNHDQMESLCKRLVLLSQKRTVNSETLREHLHAMSVLPQSGTHESDDPRNPRAVELLEVLNRCHGSREKAAAELGISKTTLWRKMKKYGIDRDLTL